MSSKSFSFIIASDPHIQEPSWPGLAQFNSFLQQIEAHPEAAFILLLGDLFWEAELSELEALLSEAHCPIHVVYGNHDVKRIEQYEALFGLRDCSFEFNGCLFVLFFNSLATPYDDNHAGGSSEAQWEWIEEQLRQGWQKGLHHLFLAAHVPPFTPQGYHQGFFLLPEDDQRLTALCKRYGVTACFFGHLHQSISFIRDDTQILICPSLNWNFAPSLNDSPSESSYQKVLEASYRLVHVDLGTKIKTDSLDIRVQNLKVAQTASLQSQGSANC